MILQHTYPSAVLSVKMNRLRLVVCLEESLYIHNIRDMSILHTIRDTPPNPRGVCALVWDRYFDDFSVLTLEYKHATVCVKYILCTLNSGLTTLFQGSTRILILKL